jgi:uncharacterized protein (DUF1778 family)
MARKAPKSPESTTFNARLDGATKDVLARAAEIRGESMTDFVLGAAYDRAVETIRQRHVVELSGRDSALFAGALAAPAGASAKVVSRFVAAHRRSQR